MANYNPKNISIEEFKVVGASVAAITGDQLPTAVGNIITLPWPCYEIQNNHTSAVTVAIKPIAQTDLIADYLAATGKTITAEYVAYKVYPDASRGPQIFTQIDTSLSTDYDNANVIYCPVV
jgi:hypothetical protein